MLQIRNELPDGFFAARAKDLKSLLGGPTLFEFDGVVDQPLFVSVLQHGNEPAGFEAIKTVLAKYAVPGSDGKRPLPRSLRLFVGNVDAAERGERMLDGQPDYNRNWPGCEPDGSPEQKMLADLTQRMRDQKIFASLDIHNNTGLNPHYACINRLSRDWFYLATMFSHNVTYFVLPKGVQSLAFNEFCPSVTVECGKSGDAAGEAHAAEYIDACLHLHAFPEHPFPPHDIDLFHTIARVRVPEGIEFSCHSTHVPLAFNPRMESWNFTELEPGAEFCQFKGSENGEDEFPLIVEPELGENTWSDYFEVRDHRVLTKKPLMPSMLTLDERVVRQDCLCYLMERIPLPADA